jgi:excisionase family DNA binding protein
MTSSTVPTGPRARRLTPGPLTASLLTSGEVAALYRVATKTVVRWADTGRLRCVRTLGGHRRFPADQFADHVQALHAHHPAQS